MMCSTLGMGGKGVGGSSVMQLMDFYIDSWSTDTAFYREVRGDTIF